MRDKKIGIPSVEWFVLFFIGVLISFSWFSVYMLKGDFSFLDNIKRHNLIFMILFVGLIFSFKIVKIDKQGIYIFYPFILKKQEILWRNLIDSNWRVEGSIRGIDYRVVTLKSEKKKILLRSLEYANFDTLISQIPKSEHLQKEINIAYVKNSKRTIIFYIALFSLGVLEESYLYFYKDYLRENGLVLGISIILLYTNIKRLIWCNKIESDKA